MLNQDENDEDVYSSVEYEESDDNDDDIDPDADTSMIFRRTISLTNFNDNELRDYNNSFEENLENMINSIFSNDRSSSIYARRSFTSFSTPDLSLTRLLNQSVFNSLYESLFTELLDTALNQSFADYSPPIHPDFVLLLPPPVKYKRGVCAEKDCCICLDDFIENEDVSILPDCKHVFHEKCIFEWGKLNPTCPVCRDEIETEVPDS
jgi:hypothetical protein